MTLPRLRAWLPFVAGGLLAWGVILLLPVPPTPLPSYASVGFLLCAVIAVCLFAMWWRADDRDTDHEQRLMHLETLVADWLPDDVEQVAGWPEEEPNPIDPPTDEIPAQRPTPQPREEEPTQPHDRVLLAHWGVDDAALARQAARAQDLEDRIAEIRARTAARNAVRPVAEEAK